MNSLTEKTLHDIAGDIKLTVCDIGANPIGGDAPYKELLDFGLVKVIGFEPQLDSLKTLNEQKSDNETYYPYALGDGNKVKLNICKGSGFTSCLEPDINTVNVIRHLNRYMRVIEEIEMDTVRLDSINEIQQIDFLKIDVQGSELSIIKNGLSKLNETLAMQIEVRFLPLYRNEPMFGDIDVFLRNHNFELFDLIGLKRLKFNTSYGDIVRRRDKRQLIDCDAIYVRHLRNLETYDNSSLRKLCMLALSVFKNVDIFVYAAEEMVKRDLLKRNVIEKIIQNGI